MFAYLREIIRRLRAEAQRAHEVYVADMRQRRLRDCIHHSLLRKSYQFAEGLAMGCRCSETEATRALGELEDAGLVHSNHPGDWSAYGFRGYQAKLAERRERARDERDRSQRRLGEAMFRRYG